MNLSPVAHADLSERTTLSQEKGSGETERVKDSGKNIWIQQQVGIQVAYTLNALLSDDVDGVC